MVNVHVMHLVVVVGGGLVESHAEGFVKSRKGTIPNAKALFDFCQENSAIQTCGNCTHKLRTFFSVEKVDRDCRECLLQTVKITQTLYDVCGVREGVVKVRHLACFVKFALEYATRKKNGKMSIM